MKCGTLKTEAQSTENVTALALSLMCLYIILYTDLLIPSRRCQDPALCRLQLIFQFGFRSPNIRRQPPNFQSDILIWQSSMPCKLISEREELSLTLEQSNHNHSHLDNTPTRSESLFTLKTTDNIR